MGDKLMGNSFPGQLKQLQVQSPKRVTSPNPHFRGQVKWESPKSTREDHLRTIR
jgi:hypothetical protein